jgi:hypothetical protein
MRPLIICIAVALLTQFAVGQEGTDSVAERNTMTHTITLEDLENYVKECYADSVYTILTGWWEEPVVEVKTQKEAEEFYLAWGKRGQWTHRNPTLPGFMEFLRRSK